MDIKLITHHLVCLELHHLSSICCHSKVLNYAQGHVYHYLYTSSIGLGLFGLPYFIRIRFWNVGSSCFMQFLFAEISFNVN